MVAATEAWKFRGSLRHGLHSDNVKQRWSISGMKCFFLVWESFLAFFYLNVREYDGD